MPKKTSNSASRLESHFFQVKHLLQIIWAVQATLFLVILQRLYLEQYLIFFVLVGVVFVLIAVSIHAKKNKVEEAASCLLIVITGLLTYFMWAYGGIFDEAVFAYPCILIMAAMLGLRLLFLCLSAFVACSIMLNGIVNSYGIYTNTSTSVDIDSAMLITLILILTGYTISVMAKDFRKILVQLDDENKIVLKSKNNIEMLLRHDILTEMPNRLMAEEFFQRAMAKCGRDNAQIHLMFIDLDNFKLMNDAFGHQAGDLLLIEISARLKGIVRGNDLVCRFAGDEFVIIFESLTNPELVASIAKKVISVVKKPFHYQGHEFICGCSIGVSVAPNEGRCFDVLVRNADTAMYHSKSVGGNSFHYFNDEMNTYGHEYLSLITYLRKAIKEKQFFLVYQPKIDLKENKIIGAEALIRWNHPEKGVVFPNEFIGEAEKAGLICEIGEWVLQQACRTCKEWVFNGLDEFSIAVNVSAKQFARGNLSQIVKNALEESNLSGKNLELEMTESLLIDNSTELKNTFKYIQSLGVSFSVDDFGTGYSNLGYLKEFDISSLKIDRSFIHDIANKPNNKSLVKAIIQMARGLELHTVAEGVEDTATADMLTDFQCDSAQGYLWSKPLTQRDFTRYIKVFNEGS
ncbi:MAG: EAL domain-containing protein [Colwellia sp.]